MPFREWRRVEYESTVSSRNGGETLDCRIRLSVSAVARTSRRSQAPLTSPTNKVGLCYNTRYQCIGIFKRSQTLLFEVTLAKSVSSFSSLLGQCPCNAEGLCYCHETPDLIFRHCVL